MPHILAECGALKSEGRKGPRASVAPVRGGARPHYIANMLSCSVIFKAKVNKSIPAP